MNRQWWGAGCVWRWEVATARIQKQLGQQQECQQQTDRRAWYPGWMNACCERTDHAQHKRSNPGKGANGIHWCRGRWGKCGIKVAARLRAKGRRKELCWSQKAQFPLKSLVKRLFKSVAAHEWWNIYESLIYNSSIYELPFPILLTLSFLLFKKKLWTAYC